MSVVLSAQDISRALTRISHEILEKNHGSSEITVLGIPTRGAHLAARIAAIMSSIEGKEIAHGTLDITLYRDDLRLVLLAPSCLHSSHRLAFKEEMSS